MQSVRYISTQILELLAVGNWDKDNFTHFDPRTLVISNIFFYALEVWASTFPQKFMILSFFSCNFR